MLRGFNVTGICSAGAAQENGFQALIACRQGFTPAGARRGLSGRPRHPFGAPLLISLRRFQRRQVVVALLAAVATTKLHGIAPTGATKGRSPSGGFPIALWKPSAPTYKLVAFPTLVGRGGSVSRRDHNQAARNRAHLAWAHKLGGKIKPIPSYSSGEGVWGRGASLREAASPPAFPYPRLFKREREGRGLSEEKPPPPQVTLPVLSL